MSIIKALCFYTLIVFGLILVSFGSEANAQSIQISIPTTGSGNNGTQVLIPINLTNNGGAQIVDYNIAVTFDPAVLQPVAGNEVSTAGTLSSSFTVTPDTNTSGRIGIAAATGGAGFNTSGVLLYMRFNVIGTANTATGFTNLNFEANPLFEANSGGNNVVTVPTTASNGTFTVVLAPTAASVNLGGRVLLAGGRGLRGAMVTLTEADGTTRTVTTTTSGSYRFTDVQAGQTVTIRVISKKYRFQPQTVNVSGEMSDLNFVGR